MKIIPSTLLVNILKEVTSRAHVLFSHLKILNSDVGAYTNCRNFLVLATSKA